MRSIIQDGSDDWPPTFVMRGTTKWWSPYDKGMTYDTEGGGNTYYLRGNRYERDREKRSK